ncbi:DUF5684 domain-containing protein [Chryseobacterium sp. CT-SW4]|uniref:DUF5684 domain-containing protein n=1 Tax=Chryseobacterium sp. SW-1 TaxID=3157343 RepID=UPI003B0254DB
MLTILQAGAYDSSVAAAGVGFGMLIFELVLYVFYGYCMYKIFQKAGVENAWAAFIPIYNVIVLIQIIKKPVWWIVLLFIPLVNLYAAWVIWDRVAKGFRKDTPVYTILLFFLGFIFIPVLAFGNDSFDANEIPNEQ